MSVEAGITATQGAIETQVAAVNDRANNSVTAAFNAINNMAAAAQSVPPFISFTAPNVNLPAINTSAFGPDRPTATLASITASIGVPPADFVAEIAERIVQQAPQETFTTPTIVFPTAPTLSSLVKPSALPIALPDNMPDVPSFTLPSELTVGGFTFPAVPAIATPNWDIAIPSLSIDLPQTTLAYVEPSYISSLKTAIEASLLDGVQNGGTGLGTTIETDIWNRQVERLTQQKNDDVDEAIGLWAGRGFSMPNGMVNERVVEIQDRYTDERSQASRDVAIKQAEIAVDMTKFFLSTGLNNEQLYLTHANNVANRALEAEKSVVEFSIALFNANVSKYNLQLERYKAQSVEIEGRIKIQALILQAYQAELSSLEIQDKVDRTAIDNYKAILSSHETAIRLYESEVSAKIAEMNIEAKKIDIFKAEISGYVAEIDSQKSEMELYVARIGGESAKIDLHKTEVEAYATRVGAIKTSNDTVIAQINSDIAVEDMNLKAHLANVEIYGTKSRYALGRLSNEGDMYRSDISMYQSELQNSQAFAEQAVNTAIRAASLDQMNAQMGLEASKANLTAVTESNKIRLTASQAMAQASAALAGMTAGAIQGVLQLGGQGTSIENTEVS